MLSKINGPQVTIVIKMKRKAKLLVDRLLHHFGDEDATFFAACRKLCTVDWSFCFRLTDAAAAQLARIPTLRAVNLAQCRLLTDEAARLLAQLPELTEVNVEFCRKMTDSAARHFSGCPALHTLHVGWAISDLGAQHLARSESIEVLHLSGNALTDAGARPPLPHFRCFTNTQR